MINQPKKVEAQIFGTTFGLETGKLAKQTSGSVLARYGDTVVLATVSNLCALSFSTNFCTRTTTGTWYGMLPSPPTRVMRTSGGV